MANPHLTSLPNLITYARIVLIPVVVALILPGDPTLRAIALALFIIAAISDWLDGYLARKWNQASALGRMLDPIADKLLVGALIVTLAWDHSLSAIDLIPAIAILLREIFISGLREFLGGKLIVKVTQLAKWKTTVQLVAFIVILLEPLTGGTLWLVSDILLWLAGILTVWTGAFYLLGALPALVSEE